jgi:hypothetical protein
VLSRWGIRVRFGHRTEHRRGRERALERRPAHGVPDPPLIEPTLMEPTLTEPTLTEPGRAVFVETPHVPVQPRRAVLFDEPAVEARPRPRVDEVAGIFSHADASPVPTRPLPTSEPRPRPRVERRREIAPDDRPHSDPPHAQRESVPAIEERPRRVTILDTQVRRRKMRGKIGLVLGWRNEALHAGARVADASLTVMRLSVDVHLRTRAARIDYAKTFSLALGREVAASRTTRIAAPPHVEHLPVEEHPLDTRDIGRYDHVQLSPLDRIGPPETTEYRAPAVPLQDTYVDTRDPGVPFVAPAPNGHHAHRSGSGGYGPGN